MPRWRALPDELDPQVRELASRLRRLVDDSSLSVSAVADRTGYGKTSWERYLGGRLLPPREAVEALAELTGADAGLLTLWELAERAWNSSEAWRDAAMDPIRASPPPLPLPAPPRTPAPAPDPEPEPEPEP
ncbi:MAG TPA: hypothetical protein DEQ61_17555, partial [Streptomyces sp.]|nr:hypothetical protein [Streptomyces sp.]